MYWLHPAWAHSIGCSHHRHRSIGRGGGSHTRGDLCRVRFYISWWVNSTPLLQFKNHFAPLFINENPESNSSYSPEPGNDSSAIHPIPDSPPLHPKCIPRWEWWLPKCYVLAATPSERSLNLDVVIQTTDTGEVHAVSVLLDSGATGLFIDPKFMQWNRLSTRSLAWVIPVYNVDRTPNEQSAVCDIVDDVMWFHDHTEWAQFTVTELGKSQMILGLSWL